MVALGYLLARVPGWRRSWTAWASRFVFALALPALLFQLLSQVASMPHTDPRLLLAYFGGCLLVFAFGRVVARGVFGLDGAGQSVFAMGGVFSNNVLLGVPIAKSALGAAAVPSAAMVIVFNSLILWSLVTISVEWSRHGAVSIAGFGKTALSVVTNPIVLSILCGTAFGYTGWSLPAWLSFGLSQLGRAAGPSALIVLGLGLAEYGIRAEIRQSFAISAIKLLVQPLVVWLLAAALGLPAMELKVVVLLASMSVGANVYLMALQFEVARAAVAGSLVLSTMFAALSTPVLLALLSAADGCG